MAIATSHVVLAEEVREMEFELQQAFNAEVLELVNELKPEDFMPCPDGYKQVLKLDPKLRKHWMSALRSEIME